MKQNIVIYFILFCAFLNAQTISRGPYLQMGTPTSIVVRWRTNNDAGSWVHYGTDSGVLSLSESDGTSTKEHEIALSGLLPNTKYYYAVGYSAVTLASGTDYFFITSPPTGTAEKLRIWVLGDAGTASVIPDDGKQQKVRDAYYTFTGSTYTNLWVMLGDNAYNNGTDVEYQAAVFDMYPTMLRKSVLWPAFGNHDGYSASSPTQSGVFYNIFTLPDNAQAGGVATGTEAFYSFNYANIHFICLNSHDVSRITTGPMLVWLVSDLAANNADWTIAFWHHPPYSKGSHDSDTDAQMSDMRENALPILENGGVDLVLTGHSHAYERSFLLNGHYGESNTLTSGMILDNGNGKSDEDGAYEKAHLGPHSHEGAVYIVAGSSGKTGGGSLNHPAMYAELNVLGSVILDVENNQLDVTFLNSTEGIDDYFTIIKGTDETLAVELTTFKAISDNHSVILRWATASEVDNLGFIILRSTEKSGIYEEIDSYVSNDDLKGKGSYSNNSEYEFFDKQVFNGTTYWYKLVDINRNGERKSHGPVFAKPYNSSIRYAAGYVPDNFALHQNKPNPFNSNTRIKFDIPALEHAHGALNVNLAVFNLLGQKIAILYDGVIDPGSYIGEWDGFDDFGNSAPSGVYIYRIISDHFNQSKRMLLLK